jgi:hypothetical protein
MEKSRKPPAHQDSQPKTRRRARRRRQRRHLFTAGANFVLRYRDVMGAGAPRARFARMPQPALLSPGADAQRVEALGRLYLRPFAMDGPVRLKQRRTRRMRRARAIAAQIARRDGFYELKAKDFAQIGD